LKLLEMGNRQLGDLAEDRAADLLAARGYRIITRKFRCRTGEIDIIADDGGTLVFVEVRSRRDDEHGMPYETIDKAKKAHIRKTALFFQLKNGMLERDSRFDCISVLFDGKDNIKNMELITDAFWS